MLGILREILKRLAGRGPPRRPNTTPNRPGCTGNCRRLPRQAVRPGRRHDICGANASDRTRNDVTSMIEPGVDVAGDMAALNAGDFTPAGDNFVVNGRTYGMHPETGRTFPISGPGIHNFDRGEHQFLRQLNSRGEATATNFARNFPGMSDAKIQRVLDLWRLCQ